jgi:hypothetical protein
VERRENFMESFLEVIRDRAGLAHISNDNA